MQLRPGTALGTYEVVALLGAGGMGEVYRARDKRLGRDVALKILPDAFAQDPDRRQRFEREAHLLASLNHANIATIHGIEESGGVKALVLELVEGQTLAELVARGPVPVSTALALARQIAEALEAAHAAGVVHRDLKPANIKVHNGRIKVLDFGLAKALEPSAAGRELASSPTVTSPAVTRVGVVLGTAAYMAPEQARGEPVGEQADIWAFGCVLFEMLAGRAAFPGRSVSDVIAAILRADPDWQALPSGLHPRVRLLLERCLEKDTANRCHAIADARVDLTKALADPAGVPTAAAAAPSRRAALRWVAVGAVVGAVGAGLVVWTLRAPQARPTQRFSDVLPPGRVFTSSGHPHVAVSPDGSQVAYVANSRLFLRALDQGEARAIPGTEGEATTPFFSPDGRFIGYYDLRDGELRRIAIAGGTPLGIVKVTNVFGARWQSDDTILYGAEDGVWRVPADGGPAESVLRINPGERLHGPQLLPGGDGLLYTWRTTIGGWEDSEIVVHSLRSGQRKVIRTGADARYLPTGHLVYADGNVLFAVAFDLAFLDTVGAPVPLVDGVERSVRFPGNTGTANYDISATGLLVYVSAVSAPVVAPLQLVAVDRSGTATPLVAERRPYWRPRVSPDGSRIAVEVRNERNELHPWIVDLTDGSAAPLPTDGAINDFYAWTPDGRSLLYRSVRSEGNGIYRQPADGSGAAELLLAATDDAIVGDVSREGVLVYTSGEQTARRSILTMRLDDRKAVEYLATPAMEHMPAFSPDGRWIAYASNETGLSEIYVRSYPAREGLVRRVSDGGGTAPVWAPDGSELYFRNAAGMLVALPVRRGEGITTGRPRELFRVQGRFRTSGNAAAYDIERTGRRFIMVTEEENPQEPVQQVNVVLNWLEELKVRVPAR